MKAVDKGYGEDSLESVWSALACRLAVSAGLVTALVALYHGLPVHVACLRGGIGWLGVLLVARIGAWFAARDSSPDGPRIENGPQKAPKADKDAA